MAEVANSADDLETAAREETDVTADREIVGAQRNVTDIAADAPEDESDGGVAPLIEESLADIDDDTADNMTPDNTAEHDVVADVKGQRGTGAQGNSYAAARGDADDVKTGIVNSIGAARNGNGTGGPSRTARAQNLNDLPDLRERKGQNRSPAVQDDEEPDPESVNRDEFTTVYDLVDQIESSLDEAKTSVLFPGTVRVNRDEFTELFDQLKTTLPVQLERASSLMREAERRLENAQSQAAAMVAQAQSNAEQVKKDAAERAEFLAGHERVTELAQQKARDIISQAQAQSTKLTQGANAYCANVMSGLEKQLDKYSQDVQNGITVLTERQEAAARQFSQNGNNQTQYPEAQ